MLLAMVVIVSGACDDFAIMSTSISRGMQLRRSSGCSIRLSTQLHSSLHSMWHLGKPPFCRQSLINVLKEQL